MAQEKTLITSMMPTPEYFTQAMTFVWLLRKDVSERLLKDAGSPNEAFRMFCAWWVVYGRKEFPYHEIPPEVARIAQEKGPSLLKKPMTRIMAILYQHVRDELASPSDFHPWFFVFGVTTYDLFAFIDESEKKRLGLKAQDIPQDASLPITQLMAWLWTFRPDVQSAFPLSTQEGRESFLAWFIFFGLKEHELFPYLSAKEIVSWLKPLAEEQSTGSPPLSVLMKLAMTAELPETQGLSIETNEDRKALALVTRKMMASGGRLEPVRRLLHGLGSPLANDTSPARFLQKEERQSFLRNKLEHSEFGVNLVGYALGELGIGEDVRMLAKALETAGVPFTILNRQPGPEIREMDFSVAEHLSTETPYPITIIAMTGFDTALLWMDRPDLFESTHVVGFWPWELPNWPKEWDVVYDLVDEIWASTRYTQNAYTKRAPILVKHVPMAVDLPRPSLLSRKDFGLDPEAFLFLFVFDFMSYPARKNPEGAIAAFRDAFPQGNEKVGLVLKVSNRVESDPRWLSLLETIQNDPRIRLIGENLDRRDLIALMKACDAYISLHRAEGFGRTLAEAMLLEKAVVATNFSGNVDYLDETTGYPVTCQRVPIQPGDYPFSDHQSWAEPDTGDAARHLKAIVGDPVTATRRAKAGKKRISSVHGPKIVGKNLRRHLEDIHLNAGNPTALPKASPPIQNVQRKRTA